MILECNVDLIEHYDRYAALCIPTNGQVRESDGQAVMGKGFALAARERWPELGARLGGELNRRGNVPAFLGSICGGLYAPYFSGAAHDETAIFSFPTKHKWKDRSKLDLIEQSAKKIVLLADMYDLTVTASIALPRPGCGAGGLRWDAVRPILDACLDRRFVLVSL